MEKYIYVIFNYSYDSIHYAHFLHKYNLYKFFNTIDSLKRFKVPIQTFFIFLMVKHIVCSTAYESFFAVKKNTMSFY